MARLSWNVFVQDSGDEYTADGTIYRPNETLEIPKISTEVKTKLATGDNAFITPSTKSVYQPISFMWLELSDSDFNNLRAKLVAYMDASTTIKITDHNAVDYIGRFTSIESNWIVGKETDEYDVEVIFERHV